MEVREYRTIFVLSKRHINPKSKNIMKTVHIIENKRTGLREATTRVKRGWKSIQQVQAEQNAQTVVVAVIESRKEKGQIFNFKPSEIVTGTYLQASLLTTEQIIAVEGELRRAKGTNDERNTIWSQILGGPAPKGPYKIALMKVYQIDKSKVTTITR